MLNSYNHKAEMINRVNAWLEDYASDNANMEPLEAMAEVLLESAKMAGYDVKEANRYADDYSDDFVPANLVAAMKALKKEVEAA